MTNKVEKSPSMPFYGKQFYDDESVWLSSLAHQGLYVALLWSQWANGSIPEDIQTIARLVGQKEGDVRKLWGDMRRYFEPVAEGRLCNPQLERVRAGLVKLREGRRKAGSKGGSKAQANRVANPQANVQANDQHPIGEGKDSSEHLDQELDEGSGEKPTLTPRQIAEDMVLEAFAEDLRPHPGIIARWIDQLCEARRNPDPIPVAEAIREIVWKNPTKPPDYIGKCVGTAATEALSAPRGSYEHRRTDRRETPAATHPGAADRATALREKFPTRNLADVLAGKG